MTSPPLTRILVVDDEPDIKLVLQQKFRKQVKELGWQFEYAHNGAEALRCLQEGDFDMMLTDLNMPVMDGLCLLRELTNLDRELRAVVISAYGDLANIRSAMNLGAFDFVTKPIDLGDLEATILKTLALVHKLKEARRVEREALEAEAARRARSRFLVDMSQELRTPLNAIILFTEMLTEEAEGSADHLVPDLRKIRAAGQHLLTLVNDVVDMSKIEAGTIKFKKAEVQVADLLAEVADIQRAEVEKTGNRLEVRAGEGDGSMLADPTRVRQVLFALLGNAARFTQGGTVILEAVPTHGFMAFRVQDSGCGMSTEQVESIFRPHPESGARLSTTRRLIELMGGRLRVESQVGQGSTFTVELPLMGVPSP